MSIMDELKPTRKALVMDLLIEANFDVSDWKNVRGQPPARNPKYCYSWSFEQPGEAVAICLWHKDLKLLKKTVAYHRKANAAVHRRHKSPVWNLRNSQLDARLELAFRQQLPVRAIVLDETKRSDSPNHRTKASIVAGRMLDPTLWAVTKYNYDTGECWLVRGEKPTTPAVDAPDLEVSWFEGRKKRAFVYHRQREARARRKKIRECLERNGGKLVCEVPMTPRSVVARYARTGEG